MDLYYKGSPNLCKKNDLYFKGFPMAMGELPLHNNEKSMSGYFLLNLNFHKFSYKKNKEFPAL